MKTISFSSFALFSLVFFISACDSENAPADKLIPVKSTIVEVQRGPVYNATVMDAKGNLASDYNNSNFYEFNILPSYPLRVLATKESWIDIDADNNKTSNDVTLDVNMSSYWDVVTPVTTILSDTDAAKREILSSKLSQMFDIPQEELYKSSSNSQNANMAILTNAVYKLAKEQNIGITQIFNYETLITDSNTSLQNEFDALKNIVENNSSFLSDGNIDALKIEQYLHDTYPSLFTSYVPPQDLPYREVFTTAEIEEIWDISFAIDNTKTYANINIGIEIQKYEDDGSNDIVEFVYSGVNISSDTSVPTRIDIWGETDSKSGGTWINEEYNTNGILERSMSVSADTLKLNLGAIIKEQTAVSESSFRVAANYSITVVSSAPIFKNSANKTLSLINNKFIFISEQGMSGELKIK